MSTNQKVNRQYFNQVMQSSNDNVEYYKAIDWNRVEEDVDKATWEKLVEQFWTDTRIPVSQDLPDWRNMTQVEKDVFNRAFVGLTLLDTLQSEEGNKSLLENARTQHEKAVITNIMFMESMHAKSYSTIFQSLNTTREIDEIFEWGNNNELLQKKARIINDVYQNGESWQKKIASVFLESFLFYSGFYTPLYWLGHNKMPNSAEVIKLILRDEATHGSYIGYKFQLAYNEMPEDKQQEVQSWLYSFLMDLYENEVEYTKTIYSEIGWVQEVTTFIKYNANKALQNLGFPSLFENADVEDVNPVVINGLSTSTTTHDFFSAVGNGYKMGEAEAMEEDDYDF